MKSTSSGWQACLLVGISGPSSRQPSPSTDLRRRDAAGKLVPAQAVGASGLTTTLARASTQQGRVCRELTAGRWLCNPHHRHPMPPRRRRRPRRRSRSPLPLPRFTTLPLLSPSFSPTDLKLSHGCGPCSEGEATTAVVPQPTTLAKTKTAPSSLDCPAVNVVSLGGFRPLEQHPPR